MNQKSPVALIEETDFLLFHRPNPLWSARKPRTAEVRPPVPSTLHSLVSGLSKAGPFGAFREPRVLVRPQRPAGLSLEEWYCWNLRTWSHTASEYKLNATYWIQKAWGTNSHGCHRVPALWVTFSSVSQRPENHTRHGLELSWWKLSHTLRSIQSFILKRRRDRLVC